jgi:hypothetical protein
LLPKAPAGECDEAIKPRPFLPQKMLSFLDPPVFKVITLVQHLSLQPYSPESFMPDLLRIDTLYQDVFVVIFLLQAGKAARGLGL